MSKQTPFISALTKYLGVRRHKMWLRYKEDISPRTIPEPNLPPGSHSKIAHNYYYSRDERRKVTPPTVIMNAHRMVPKLASGDQNKTAQTSALAIELPTPGFRTQWTISKDQPNLRE